MDINMASKLYKENSLMTLSPRKFIVWILGEALKALEKGKGAILNKDIAEQNNQLQITQQLILEIIPLINEGIDGGKKLILLIEYVHRRLVEANIDNDVEILKELEAILSELKSAWEHA
ncbi:flagellar export chaperone FliS [Metabacillus fastidiosus]|uniref:flagellar export chaperone FliS n=1 Tax=Metabacillus fastidiosus TaxID=1458 RepID=UPI002DBD4153|nr:flagellar export chaperone FliS [Metabacillus fastidiosus]MEC2077295.1 flagellar export chaperone FliS [Metabacillus fastidiosus]